MKSFIRDSKEWTSCSWWWRLCLCEVCDIVSFELLKKKNQNKYISDQAEDIISFKGLFAQDPTEAIIAKKTCGALKAGVRSRYNILVSTQVARSPTDQEIRTQPGTAWLTWQTVTPLIMNIGRRHMKPVLGFHTTSWMSVTCIVAKHLHSLMVSGLL